VLGLILAGGRGTRFGRGEKPLALCAGRPMIERVADALTGAGLEIVVVTSPSTPFTRNWCSAHGLACLCAGGAGYVEDLAEAAGALGVDGPLLCVSSDLPCLTPSLVERVLFAYAAQPLPALSVWVPVGTDGGAGAPCIETFDGTRAVPAGINVLYASRMEGQQEEARLLIDEPRLRYNVNTPGVLLEAETFLAATGDPPCQGTGTPEKG